jgi:hypothetical protein
MAEFYNPIVRTFGELRSSLMRITGRARHEIRPSTYLDELLPVKTRRAAWEELQHDWSALRPLKLPDPFGPIAFFTGLFGAIILSFALKTIVPVGIMVFIATRPWAREFPLKQQTVGDLVMELIRFADHQESGYRWSRKDIALRVRAIIAEQLDVPLKEVMPGTTFAELGFD